MFRRNFFLSKRFFLKRFIITKNKYLNSNHGLLTTCISRMSSSKDSNLDFMDKNSSKDNLIDSKIKKITDFIANYHQSHNKHIVNSHDQDTISNIIDDYVNTNEYLQILCLNELKAYINNRLVQNGFIPNRMKTTNDEGISDNRNHALFKIIGEHTMAVDTSYWSLLNEKTRLEDLHLNQYEILYIINKILDKINQNPNTLLPLYKGLIELGIIENINDIVLVYKLFKKAKRDQPQWININLNHVYFRDDFSEDDWIQ